MLEAMKRAQEVQPERWMLEAMKRAEEAQPDRWMLEAMKRAERFKPDRAILEATKHADLMQTLGQRVAALDSFANSNVFLRFERVFAREIRQFDEIRGFASELLSRPIPVTADEMLSMTDVSQVESILESDAFNEISSLTARVRYLSEQIENSQGLGRSVKALILTFMLGMICNLVSARLYEIVFHPKPSQTVQQLRKGLQELRLTKQQTDEMRIVGRTGAFIYQRRNGKSRTLGHLKLGQVVILVRKQSKWCLISNGNTEGWARSKYLEPIAK
jgi:hypothetical protein